MGHTPLKKLMFENGHTNRWLARKCDADETGISQIVNGKRNPSLLLALKIADALETTVEALWGYLKEGENS